MASASNVPPIHLCSLLKHTPDCTLHPGYTILIVVFSFFLSVQGVGNIERGFLRYSQTAGKTRCVLSRHGLSNLIDFWVDLWMFRLANWVKSILDRAVWKLQVLSFVALALYLGTISPGVLNLRVSWRTIFIMKVVGLCNEVFCHQLFSVTILLCTFDKSNINEHSSVFDRPLVTQALPLSSSNCIKLSGQFSIYAVFLLLLHYNH